MQRACQKCYKDIEVLLLCNCSFAVKEVQSYLDPGTADEMTLSDAAKAEIILAGEFFFHFALGYRPSKNFHLH